MLRKLVRQYAIRAREFSDAVASLGEHARNGPELPGLSEIRRLQALCISSSRELERYVEQGNPAALALVPIGARGELSDRISVAKKEVVDARNLYQSAEKEFRELTAQAHDVGLGSPDGAMAVGNATRNLHRALQQYQTAISKLTALMIKPTSESHRRPRSSKSAASV
jgi:hypothetical protein